MKLESPRPHLQSLPPVSVLSQINPVHVPPIYFLKIHFKIILSSMPRLFKWSLCLWFPHQTLIHLSFPSYVLHVRLSHSSWFNHPPNTWCRTQFTKLHIMQSTPLLCCYLVPQTASSAHNSPTSSAYVPPPMWEDSFTPIDTNRQNYGTVYFNLYIFG